jgi:hypothetical protein
MKKKTISVAKNTPAVVTVPGTGGDLHDEDPLSALRIRTAAQAGRDLGRDGRLALMQTIGARFGVPPEGFPTGQSRIYVDGDIRFEQTLRVLSRAQGSNAASANLKRTAQLVDTDIFLVLTTTARECQGLTARDSHTVDSYREGGLDYLEDIKDHLGLPKSIVGKWTRIPPYESGETHHRVHPCEIPMRDQILGYAAVTRLNFKNFQAHVKKELGGAAGQALLDSLSKESKSVWQAYAFVAHGGTPFDPHVGPHHGQQFGVISAFGYLRHLAFEAGVPFDMNAILTTPSLHHTDYVRISKARAMEAAFFEQMLTQTAPSAGASSEP